MWMNALMGLMIASSSVTIQPVATHVPVKPVTHWILCMARNAAKTLLHKCYARVSTARMGAKMEIMVPCVSVQEEDS